MDRRPLLVALLALGIMNVAWMLVPAAVALLEKLTPFGRVRSKRLTIGRGAIARLGR